MRTYYEIIDGKPVGEWKYEIIEGVKNYMSPSAGAFHHKIDTNIIFEFEMYCRKNNCGIVFGDIDVHLPDGNVYRPDINVICDRSIIKRFVYGAPDLIVEILSKSTAKNDLTIKKDSYEKNGVKEYWIVNPKDKSIQVYHLVEGKYILDDIYAKYSQDELEELDEDERANIKKQIKVSIFDDLYVNVDDVFHGLDD